MDSIVFENKLNGYISIINKRLDELLEIKYPKEIYEAMRYSVFAGGKRLRPVLLLAFCEMFGGKTEDALDFACAIEMIHTYSLIHDDLPAMDNDDYRRGKLTCHKKFNEAIAILAGDALLNKAYEVMTNLVVTKKEEKFATAMKYIADSAGTCGMVGGQVVDVLSEDKEITSDILSYIHKNKTAELIIAPLKAGCVLGENDNIIEKIELVQSIGEKVGVAFQIKDDILDVKSTTEVIGKPVFSDSKNKKTTYVTMYGIEKSEEKLKKLTEEALCIIDKFGDKNEFVYEYIKKLVKRIK